MHSFAEVLLFLGGFAAFWLAVIGVGEWYLLASAQPNNLVVIDTRRIPSSKI